MEKPLEINEDILRIRKMVIGEFNHLTLKSYSTCAALLLRLNRAQKAEYVRFPLRRIRADSPVFEEVCSPSAWKERSGRYGIRKALPEPSIDCPRSFKKSVRKKMRSNWEKKLQGLNCDSSKSIRTYSKMIQMRKSCSIRWYPCGIAG